MSFSSNVKDELSRQARGSPLPDSGNSSYPESVRQGKDIGLRPFLD